MRERERGERGRERESGERGGRERDRERETMLWAACAGSFFLGRAAGEEWEENNWKIPRGTAKSMGGLLLYFRSSF